MLAKPPVPILRFHMTEPYSHGRHAFEAWTAEARLFSAKRLAGGLRIAVVYGEAELMAEIPARWRDLTSDFFERGHRLRDQSDEPMTALSRNPKQVERYRDRSHSARGMDLRRWKLALLPLAPWRRPCR